MKKEKEKKKLTSGNKQCKQLSIHQFFTSMQNSEFKNTTCEKNISQVNTKIDNCNVGTTSHDDNLFSPETIEATPDVKLSKKFVLFDNNARRDTEKCSSTLSKKKLIFNDSNSEQVIINKKRERIYDSDCDVNSLDNKQINDDTLNELINELENSPPEEQSIVRSHISPNITYSESLSINRNKNAKKLKLSLSATAKNKIKDVISNLKLNNDEKKFDTCYSDGKHKSSDCELVYFNCKSKNNGENTVSSKTDDSSHKTKSVLSNNFMFDEQKLDRNLIDIENLDILLNDDWNSGAKNDDLHLNDWKYCEVMLIEKSNFGLILTLREYEYNLDNPLSTKCMLKGYWLNSSFTVGDIVSIKAYHDTSVGYWVIDDKEGFVIKHPDVLVTGTGIVGSLFCLRKSVLSHLFPGSDPPNFTMTIGSIIHELFQDILKKKLFTITEMKELVANIIKNQRTLFLAYECDVSLSAIHSELENFIPRVLSFVNTYIFSNVTKDSSWSGKILEIQGIEENLWVPKLGMKGKPDLIVKTNQNGRIRIMPLELKTGRASNSAEHRGQIILYSMMMSELEMNVDSGLLLYLRENVLNEINPKHPEKSGLITMRNSLVDYFMANRNLKLSENDKFAPPVLPEPINHFNACSKCSYLTVCSATLSKESNKNISVSNPLNSLSMKSIEHISSDHIQYVFQWLGLLKMEELVRKNDRFPNVSDIWRKDIKKRETRGNCISKLMVFNVEEFGSKYLHNMKRARDDLLDFTTSDIAEGDYIVVSDKFRYALATGYVNSISESSLFLKLDRCLKKTTDPVYIIDKYSSFEGLLGYNTSNLSLLLENTTSAERLRTFIIDLKLPKFSPITNTVIPEHADALLNQLNTAQKNAILRALVTEDYLLIKGMPGTGKTATLVALVKLLVQLNCTVLITSHTHSSVDNILLQLKDSVDFLRLGSYNRVHPDIKNYCEDVAMEKCTFNTVEDIQNFYNKKQVIGVTCMGCSHILFKKRTFDYCIIDESTQVLQPSLLKALYCSRRFILIGDPDQLPPIVQSYEARRLGLDESLFKRLDRPEVVSVLNVQYRMNAEIMKLANSFTYNNVLQSANKNVDSATICVKYSKKTIDQHSWLKLPLSSDLAHSVVVLDTSNLTLSDPVSNYCNQIEADITFTIIDSLIQGCGNDYDVGIIAPYREQVELLKKMAVRKKYPTEINTVDQYQGRDKDVIIYSCTAFSYIKDNGILSDKRRLTVAITRAKRKLIIVGNIGILKKYEIFKNLFNFISVSNIVSLS